ncbi:TetR/AcrR family transcriptional regulator [Mycobacterium sp.]|uniref:TetR/AcrR family transcriptional regulator n=1 Tax=Mycobacterium sp. TaxID=1785 RepID=UPI003A885CCE
MTAQAHRPELTEPAAAHGFRLRLLDGLAASIGERGYRATTVADIVRHARTSKRTFYSQFSSKEHSFEELLRVEVQLMAGDIRAAVDPTADWRQQIRQAVESYAGHIEARTAVTLSWIREFAYLGEHARPVQRQGLELLTDLLIELSGSPGFQRANVPPLTPPLAMILVGGLRELVAIAVEDGTSPREIIEPAVDAAIALLGPRVPGQ